MRHNTGMSANLTGSHFQPRQTHEVTYGVAGVWRSGALAWSISMSLMFGAVGVASAQQIAVQVGVHDIAKKDLGENRLVRVRGYLDTSGKVPVLNDVETRDTVVVDFAQSQVPINKARVTRETPAPVRSQDSFRASEAYGVLVFVVGASSLTP